MADIVRSYYLQPPCEYSPVLVIGGVSPQGDLLRSIMEDSPIVGHYDTVTNAISFHPVPTPGTVYLGVPYYYGYAIVDAAGVACKLAGIYDETRYIAGIGQPPRILRLEGAWCATPIIP